MVFGVYRLNHPPSSVDHCCNCYFITPNEPNLVVAGGSLLRIFRYVPMQEDGQIRHRLEQVCFKLLNTLLILGVNDCLTFVLEVLISKVLQHDTMSILTFNKTKG